MALLVLYGNNANYVGESIEAQRATVAAYQCIRLSQLCFFLLYSISSHHHRSQNRIYAGLTFIAQLLWIPIYFEGVSNTSKIAVAAVAIFWEQLAYMIGFSPLIHRFLHLEFTTVGDYYVPHVQFWPLTSSCLGRLISHTKMIAIRLLPSLYSASSRFTF